MTARRFEGLTVVECLACGHELAFDVVVGTYRAAALRLCRACAAPTGAVQVHAREARTVTGWSR